MKLNEMAAVKLEALRDTAFTVPLFDESTHQGLI